MEDRKYKPFAITAHTLGKPHKLYTKMLLANMDAGDGQIAATYVNAMWDTGADVCIMTKALADQLGFKYNRSMLSKSVTGESMAQYGYAYVYLVCNGCPIDVIASIVDYDIGDGEYSFIIGMSLISKGSLSITSSETGTTLSFSIPACAPVDYTKQMPEGSDIKILPLSHGKEKIDVSIGKFALAMIFGDTGMPQSNI